MKQAIIRGQSKMDSIKGGFTTFSTVSSLTFLKESAYSTGRNEYSLTLVLDSSDSGEKHSIRIRFSGVKELVLRDFGNSITQITGFDVLDVSDRQLEGIRYEIVDYEDGVIHFFCSDAEILDVS